MINCRELDCGIKVIMEKTTYVQSVAIGICVKAGAVDETPEISGVSHFIEHMMFKGTKNRTAKDIAADVDKIGGQINAFTGKEATCYYIKTLKSNAHKASEILLDMILNSNLDKTEMDKERKVICEEIKMIQDSPDDDVHDTMVEMVFDGSPLAKSIIGTKDTLDHIDPDVMRSYMEREYTRDSIVIAIAGNFDEDDICSLFAGKLKKLKASKGKKPYNIPIFRPSYKVKVKEIEQTHICMATKGVKIDDDKFYPSGLLNNVMGGSMSSRLFQNIREQKGLAYSVYSSPSYFSKEGYYNIYAGVSHDKIPEYIEGVRDELAILKKEGISDEELSTAKEQMKSAYIFAQENVTGRMFSIGKSLLITGRARNLEEVIEDYDKVDMDDIWEIINDISDLNNYCGVAISNKKIHLERIMRK